MRMVRAGVGLAVGVVLSLLLVGGCVHRSGDDSDAQIAFDKGSDELDEVERFCLRAAQSFCGGLEPCCDSINYGFERDICILLKAEQCIAPRDDGDFLPDGAEACLDRLEQQFEDCQQPLGEARMPIDIHRLPICPEAWALFDPPPRLEPGAPCGQGASICPDDQYCDPDSSNLNRTCLDKKPAEERCVSDVECQPGLFCNDYACTAVVPLNQACEYHNGCDSALCCDRQCVRAPAVDAHLCWIYNYPGGDYPSELADTENPCVSRDSNAAASAPVQ